jgi:putative transposase
MAKRRTAEQIKRLLKEVDRDLLRGISIADACRKHGLNESTFYRWRQQLAPAAAGDERKARELQAEVDRLKSLVAELCIEKAMLQEVVKKKF